MKRIPLFLMLFIFLLLSINTYCQYNFGGESYDIQGLDGVEAVKSVEGDVAFDVDIMTAFEEFEQSELSRTMFMTDMLKFDELLKGKDYKNSALSFESDFIYVDINKKKISLDFAAMYCSDYSSLKAENEIPNILNLTTSKKLILGCRDLASDIDVIPAKTGDLEQDCNNCLMKIKSIITDNVDIRNWVSVEKYLEIERKRNLETYSDKLYFRTTFLKVIYDKFPFAKY